MGTARTARRMVSITTIIILSFIATLYSKAQTVKTTVLSEVQLAVVSNDGQVIYVRTDVPNTNELLASAGTLVTTATVFPPDERGWVRDTRVYPYRAVGFLDAGCTAELIYKNVASTAAHCLTERQPDGTWKWRDISKMKLYLGKNGQGTDPNVQPFPPCNLTKARLPQAWLDGQSSPYDYATITLDCSSLGEQLGWFGVKVFPDSVMQGADVHLTCYHGDKRIDNDPNKEWDGKMYDQVAPVYQVLPNFLYYRHDMWPLCSGGPLYRLPAGPYVPYIWAINTEQSPDYNIGRRVTAEVYNMFQRTIVENGPKVYIPFVRK